MKPHVVEKLLNITNRPTLLKLIDDYNIKVKKTAGGHNFNWNNIIEIYQKKFFPKFKKNVVMAICQNKGGVGKTTTVINLGWAFSQIGKTLLIDLDSQANLSKSFNIYKSTSDITLKDILDNKEKSKDSIVKIYDDLDIIPNESTFDFWKRTAYTKENVQYLLQKILKDLKKEYDFILIDFPPAMDIAFDLGLYASDYVCVMAQPEPFSDDNLQNVLSEINRLIDDDITGLLDLKVLGFIISKLENVILMKEFTQKTIANFDVFDSKIRKNIDIPESQTKREPVFLYNENCTGSEDYFKLWVEIMEKING